MKTVIAVLISIICLPLCCQAQSLLNFPHVLEPAEFGTAGFAIVNPGPADAAVTYTLFGENGAPLKVVAETIKARGQLAKLASQLFPEPANSGWVQVTSSTTGLQGFWFAGDLVNFADGAEAAPSASELVLPLTAPRSVIHIANTGTEYVNVLMNLLGNDGRDMDMPYPQLIPPKGFFKADAAAIFPNADLALATHMRLKCTNPFAALVVVRNFIASPSSAVLNALPASTATQSVVFPHLVDGPQGNANWRSVISVTNLSANSANQVRIVFTGENGTTQTVQRSIAANGSIRETARGMFGFTDGFQNGWVRVSSTSSLPITGFVAYGETVAAGVAVVPAQSEAQTTLLFAHIADLPPWFTGLALLNANTRGTAEVEIYAMSSDGSLIGGAANVPTAQFSLPFLTKTAKLLSEWIPQTQNRRSDGGFIFVRSDMPLFGIELFFSRNTRILANVPAGKIPAGINYVPPPPR